MARLLSVVVMAGVVLVAGSAMMSTAFTTATVDRSASFTVADDTNALIELQSGSVGGTTTTNGKLQVSLSNLNKDSTFTYGDTANPDSAYIFKFNNTAGHAHGFDVSVSNFGGTFHIKNANGTSVTASSGSPATIGLADGDTAWVAVEVSTGTADETGTVTIKAS